MDHLGRVGNRSDRLRFIPRTRSDRWISVSESFRSDLGSQIPGRSQVQSGTDTVWSRKVRYRSGIQVGYPRFTRLLLMKWEIALFKLNLTVSHFTNLERTQRSQSPGAPLTRQWPLAARPHVGGVSAC